MKKSLLFNIWLILTALLTISVAVSIAWIKHSPIPFVYAVPLLSILFFIWDMSKEKNRITNKDVEAFIRTQEREKLYVRFKALNKDGYRKNY